MMRQIFLLGVLGIVLLTNACVDEIALNVDTEKRTLVIDGIVTDSLGDHFLTLSLSSVIGVGNDNILTPFGGATVALKDDAGGDFPYVETEEGTYKLSDFEAERGKMYHIDIKADGKHYQSKPAQLRSGSTITGIDYVVEERSYTNNAGTFITENRIAAKLSTGISGVDEKPYLRWRISGEYALQEQARMLLNPKKCYVKVTLDINNVSIFNTNELSGDVLFDQEIIETTYDYRFAEQFCFHISQLSISKEEYEYWSNVKEIIDIDGGLFDPPPGTLVGNLFNVDDPDDVVVGYFSVASVAFRRAFVNRDDTGFFVRGRCEGWFPPNGEPFGCEQCLDINNSYVGKPDYWK